MPEQLGVPLGEGIVSSIPAERCANSLCIFRFDTRPSLHIEGVDNNNQSKLSQPHHIEGAAMKACTCILNPGEAASTSGSRVEQPC